MPAAHAAPPRPTPLDVTERSVRGWRVLLAPSRATDVATVAAFLPVGSVHEDPIIAGAMNLATTVMEKGTRRHTAQQFAEAVEGLGVSIGGGVSDDYGKWSVTATGPTFFPALELWAESLYEASLPKEEFEKERDLALAGLRMEDDNTFSYTYRHYIREVYRGTAYEEPSDGTLESLPRITLDHLKDSHARLTESVGGLIVAAGSFDSDALLKALDRLLREGKRAAPGPARIADIPASRYHAASPMTLSKETEQGFWCVGGPTVSYADPQYPAVRVLAAVLGEGMSSRLFSRLRDDRGLAYAVGATSSPNRALGSLTLYIGTSRERMDESAAGLSEIIDEVIATKPTRDEMDRARNLIAGRFLFDHQKTSRRAHYLGFFEFMGLGWEHDLRFIDRIAAVSAEDVQDAARRFLGAPTWTALRPTPPSA